MGNTEGRDLENGAIMWYNHDVKGSRSVAHVLIKTELFCHLWALLIAFDLTEGFLILC
jgi:hypothetical protein